jgi:hypothetical protein
MTGHKWKSTFLPSVIFLTSYKKSLYVYRLQVVVSVDLVWPQQIPQTKKQTPWPSARKRTIPSDCHLMAKFSAKFCGYRRVTWPAQQIPHGH